MVSSPLGKAIPAKKKSSKKLLLLGFLGSVALVGSTGSVYAANVSINSGGAISYSQGTTTIAACDTDGITAALGAFWATASSAFELDTITLTGVADTCDGKNLTLEVFDGTVKMVTVTGTINTNASTTVLIGQADVALADANDTAASAAVTDLQNTVTTTYVNSKTAALLASDADRITIEIN